MTRTHAFLLIALALTGCTRTATDIGRGCDVEKGPVARVWPQKAAPRMDRHGRWRGYDGDRRVWEVRYTRGVPTGPYRQWNTKGELIATWPYNWEGVIDGWARWYEGGREVYKRRITPENPPDFDPIGQADVLKIWAQSRE